MRKWLRSWTSESGDRAHRNIPPMLIEMSRPWARRSTRVSYSVRCAAKSTVQSLATRANRLVDERSLWQALTNSAAPAGKAPSDRPPCFGRCTPCPSIAFNGRPATGLPRFASCFSGTPTHHPNRAGREQPQRFRPAGAGPRLSVLLAQDHDWMRILCRVGLCSGCFGAACPSQRLTPGAFPAQDMLLRARLNQSRRSDREVRRW